DHCGNACVNCRNVSQPGWAQMDAQAGTLHLAVDQFPVGIKTNCFPMLSRSSEGLTYTVPSCDSTQDFNLSGLMPLAVGTKMLDGTTRATSDMCASFPGNVVSSVNRVVYCAFATGRTVEAGESGSYTIDETLCGGGGIIFGARGHLSGKLFYKYTVQP